MALRDRQTGWQGSLGWKAAFPDAFNRLSSLDCGFIEVGHREPPKKGFIHHTVNSKKEF
jgi:hypothetical protein